MNIGGGKSFDASSLRRRIKCALELFGILIFAAFVTLTPWNEIRSYDFVDFQRNVGKIEILQHQYRAYKDEDVGLLKAISGEVLWGQLLLVGGDLISSPDDLLKTIAFITVVIMTKYAVSQSGFWVAILILCNPVFFDFVNSQQRSAFALTMIIVALMARFRLYKLAAFGASVFVHTIASPLLMILIYCRYVLSVKLLHDKAYIRLASLLLASLMAAAVIAYGRDFFLGFVEDRRAGAYEAGAHSVFYAFPWLVYGVVIALLCRDREREGGVDSFPVLSIGVFFFLSALNFYSIRFLAFALPFLPGAISNVGRGRRYLVSVILLHQAVLMFIWLKI